MPDTARPSFGDLPPGLAESYRRPLTYTAEDLRYYAQTLRELAEDETLSPGVRRVLSWRVDDLLRCADVLGDVLRYIAEDSAPPQSAEGSR